MYTLTISAFFAVGYSVQVASATGLGDVHTGQAHTDTEAGYNGPPKDDDDNNNTGGGGDGGLSIPSAPVSVVATPYVPTPVAAPVAPVEATKGDFQEVDIFIPAIPAAPVGGESKNDDGSSNGGTSGGDDGSYANLAARFDKLSK